MWVLPYSQAAGHRLGPPVNYVTTRNGSDVHLGFSFPLVLLQKLRMRTLSPGNGCHLVDCNGPDPVLVDRTSWHSNMHGSGLFDAASPSLDVRLHCEAQTCGPINWQSGVLSKHHIVRSHLCCAVNGVVIDLEECWQLIRPLCLISLCQ